MRAINHALTGSVIGLVVSEPLLAVPAAVLSHYACDALPHFGMNLPPSQELRSRLFRNLLYLDVVLCVGLVAVIAALRPDHWVLAAGCAFAAAAPDWLSFNRYRSALKHRPWRSTAYSRFATSIQWFERPIGAFVEVVWFGAGIALLLPFLHWK
jgi:hypothetical protein